MPVVKSKIVILGAGISGLATAWFLKEKHGSAIDITLVEKSPRTGGWIQTVETGGFLFETGPRSCRTKGTGRATLELIESLGLEDLVIPAHSSASQRYLYYQKQLQPLPSSLLKLPFNPLLKGWLGVAWRDLMTEKGPVQDQSIYDFFSRRIGREWTDRFIDPLVAGIYAGDIRHLSVQNCFPLFYQWEQERGSLLRGMFGRQKKSVAATPFVSAMEKHSVFSFKNGMGELPQAITQKLDAEILYNTSVNSMEQSDEGVSLHLSDDQVIDADYVISTLPVEGLTYGSVVVVNLGYHKRVLKQEGFGYLIPSSEKEAVLGCVFDSSVFPQQNDPNETRLTLMLGGAHHPQVSEWSQRECLALVQSAMSRHLGIEATPDAISISHASHAIPQFGVDYTQWKENYLKTHQSPRLIRSGSAFSGVAVNDCIDFAKKLAINQQLGVR